MILNAVVLLMNHRGRYMLARNFAVKSCESVFSSCVYCFGKGTQWELFFLFLAGLAAILYPKRESLIMYFMIALTFVFFFAGEHCMVPITRGQIELPEAIKLVNLDLAWFFFHGGTSHSRCPLLDHRRRGPPIGIPGEDCRPDR